MIVPRSSRSRPRSWSVSRRRVDGDPARRVDSSHDGPGDGYGVSRPKRPTSRRARSRWSRASAEAQQAVRELGVPASSSRSCRARSRDVGRFGMREPRRPLSRSQRARPSPDARVMIEEFIPFDREVTMLTLRHYNPEGRVVTSVMEPVAHLRPGTLYHESWQPELFPPDVERALESTSDGGHRPAGGGRDLRRGMFCEGGDRLLQRGVAAPARHRARDPRQPMEQ